MDVSLKCETCNLLLETKKALRCHVDTVHTSEKPFKCDVSVHEKKKPFNCNVCDASFTRKQSMKTHIESVHEKKKPFKCNVCNTSFGQKPQLNTHIASVHGGQKSFKCN